MAGIRYELDTADLEGTLDKMVARLRSFDRALETIGALARESIRTNFAESGRPVKWKKLKTRSGQPLRETGRLMNSIGKLVSGNTVYVGTNVVYAAVHHFGAKKGSFGTFAVKVGAYQRLTKQAFGKQLKFPVWATVSAHTRHTALPWGDIPARPFMLLQDEDITDINSLLADWIMEGKI